MDQLRSELKQLERAWNKKIPVIQLDDADFENSAAEYSILSSSAISSHN